MVLFCALSVQWRMLMSGHFLTHVWSISKCALILSKILKCWVLCILMKKLHGQKQWKTPKFTWNCCGATSFWVSTSIWESLPKAKNCFFLHVLTWVSCAYYEKYYFFGNFQAFLIVFDHVNACPSMRLLVKIHNSWV